MTGRNGYGTGGTEENRIRRITVSGGVCSKKLLGFEIREAPGEHARGKFRVLLSEEAPVVCERNVPVQLREEGNRAEALFCGYPQRTETMTEHGWRIAEIEAVSGTVLLDMEKRSRVFQDRRQTYLGIAGAVTAETGHSACILAGDDRETGGTLIQYGETDWKFLKRMASRMGLPLVPDTGYYYPRFYMGLPEGEKKELGEVLSCGICFDGRYYAVSGRCTVDRKDFICYDVVTGTRLSLGDRVTYEGRELTVSRKKQNWYEGRFCLPTALRERATHGLHRKRTRITRGCRSWGK